MEMGNIAGETIQSEQSVNIVVGESGTERASIGEVVRD